MKVNNKIKKSKEKFPEFCDFRCKYASFTSPEMNGACRRDSAVYCNFFKKINSKNTLCISVEISGSQG